MHDITVIFNLGSASLKQFHSIAYHIDKLVALPPLKPRKDAKKDIKFKIRKITLFPGPDYMYRVSDQGDDPKEEGVAVINNKYYTFDQAENL